MSVLLAARAASIAAFAGLWAVVGYNDFTRQRVGHRALLAGALGAVLLYALLSAHTFAGLRGAGGSFQLPSFYAAAGMHALLCTTAAMLLWYLRVWPAGDTKLFFLLGLYYPLLAPGTLGGAPRLFLMVLINTFIPCAALLFARATVYVARTRLLHTRRFLADMGWARELEVLLSGARQLVSGALSPLRQTSAKGLWEASAHLAPQVLSWLSGMVAMAALSYLLQEKVRSPFALSLLCMGLFLLWSRVGGSFGGRLGSVIPGVIALGAVMARGEVDWSRLLALFGNVGMFSFCLFLGTSWMMRVLSGGAAALGFILPMIIPFVMFAVARVVGESAALLRGAGADARTWMNAMPAAPALPAAHAPAAWRPMLEMMAAMGVMGLFFGLALVMVRRWDEEVRPTHRREALASYLVLAPSFVERLKADPEFFEERIGTLYADGLTNDQAEAVKEWCAKEGVSEVPLAPTMSFASWLFLGCALTALLGGRSVLEWVL